ncbi:MAG: DNA methyltransferase [Chloroflexota bacterium]|nr:DNA methyltransferase [Chloroflexota bacterium]
MNRLYYGDCFTIMQEWPNACVDLIYLDPPFNSNRQYNAIYRDETGRPLPDGIEAFCDMWELDTEREQAIRAMPVLMRESGIADDVVEFWRLWMNALRGTQPRLLAYLSYMAQRLLIMHRLLRPTGTLYLHCDPTAGHYIKILLDAIFGHKNFIDEIVWNYGTPSGGRTGGKKPVKTHDTILVYAKRYGYHVYNQQFTPYSEKYLAERFNQEDEHGRIYRTRKREGGVVTRQYLDESPGVPLSNTWTDIKQLYAYQWRLRQQEEMGYATQKPRALLERIIATSSNKGDVVLDPFCGCATTLEAAHKLGREWIGIDIAIHAVKRVARIRLTERLGLVEGQDFVVEGVPRTWEGAADLWERDKYHFQKWAVEHADGFVTTKRTADGGVDGRIYYAVPHAQDLQSMVVEVKGGKNVSIADVRALKGVLDYDSALMAGLIILHPLGAEKERNFKRFMAEAGTLDILGIPYPRMQVLTVAELLDGHRFATPTVAGRHSLTPRLPGVPR